jgi:hypothetical protein
MLALSPNECLSPAQTREDFFPGASKAEKRILRAFRRSGLWKQSIRERDASAQAGRWSLTLLENQMIVFEKLAASE